MKKSPKYTWLFYDKYDGVSHNYSNLNTKYITIESLFSSSFKKIEDLQVIRETNKSCDENDVNYIDKKIDLNMFKLIMYITDSKNPLATDSSKFTIVGVNEDYLEQVVVKGDKKCEAVSISDITNGNFLRKLCIYHKNYEGASSAGYNAPMNTPVQISEHILNKTGDITDVMIEDPNFLTCKSYDYQKRNIHWMVEREKNKAEIGIVINNEIIFGNLHYDTVRQTFVHRDGKPKLKFYGGCLVDEVGLGKTMQMLNLICLNKTDNSGPDTYVNSRATLLICPSQLCGQWKREVDKMIKKTQNLKVIQLITKVHFEKTSYKDLLDTDLVIMSFAFFKNEAYLSKWTKKLSDKKSYINASTEDFNSHKLRNIFEEDRRKFKIEADKNSKILDETSPIIQYINWHRLVVDEFHEIHTVQKVTKLLYQTLANTLPSIIGTNKWIITATPFSGDKKMCLNQMVDYVTTYGNMYGDHLYKCEEFVNYLKNDFCRRNTRKSIESEFKLPPVKHSVVWLKFTQTERMIYNAFLANPNNDKHSVFLRQLCCYPQLSEEIKSDISNCKSLEEIEKKMVSHYEKTLKLSEKALRNVELKMNKIRDQITYTERKIYKKYLKKLNYRVLIDISDLDVKNKEDIVPQEAVSGSDVDSDGDKDRDGDKDGDTANKTKKQSITVGKDNENEIKKMISRQLKNHVSKTIGYFEELLRKTEDERKKKKSDCDGKKSTYEFYNNMMKRLKRTATNDGDVDESDAADPESCPICLDEIPEDSISVTPCGHIFCRECITVLIKTAPRCHTCTKPLSLTDITTISYERPKMATTKEIKDKLSLMNIIGTKLTNVLYYIKASDERMIVFSQWDDLLTKIGSTLDQYGIKNIFCRGNIYMKDKAVREFSSNPDIRIIMLSSESTASGTNLTGATKVILVDPIDGSYEFRKNTEGQAIGRAHRMGQMKEVEVVRFIIKDTVEENIYMKNIENDKKYVKEVPVFETTDEKITLTKDKENEIAKSAKIEKPQKGKKLAVSGKVVKAIKKPAAKKKNGSDVEVDTESESESGSGSDT